MNGELVNDKEPFESCCFLQSRSTITLMINKKKHDTNLRGSNGSLSGRCSETRCIRSAHLFCSTDNKKVCPGLCSLKLLTTIPRNNWRPMLTAKNTNVWMYICIYYNRIIKKTFQYSQLLIIINA